MKNSAYWKNRFSLLEQSQNQLGVQCYADIEQQYRRAQKEIEGQIAAWYQRFAENNKVTLADARRMLSEKELEELKWDVEQYIKYGQENAINGAWTRQLENASARFHISRLEALKLHTQQSLEVMFENQLDTVDSAMREIYKSGFYHTAFEIQKGVGVGWDFATLDEKTIAKVINKPWAADGKNFSERVWGNRQKLVNELNTELTRNMILGQDPQRAIDAIAKKMNASKNVAGRLVMTEEAFFSSAAQRDCFRELDVEQFEIVATLDSNTSDICQEMDGKVFPISQWEVGVTAPPFHVNCRSTTVPAFGDEFDRIGERAARGADGKTYYVPADMTYREWKDIFANENDADMKKAISKMKNASDVLTRNRPPISLRNIQSEYKDALTQIINSAPMPIQKVILENQDKIVFAKTNAIGRARYSEKYGIFVNIYEDCSDSRGQWTALFHEMGHNLDKIYGKPSGQMGFTNALKNDFTVFTNGYAGIYNISVEEAYKKISDHLKQATSEESHILSDLFDALSGGKCRGSWGHSPDYWKSDKKVGSEAFAHFFGVSVTGNQTKLEAIRAIFPNAYEEFLKMVGEMK